MPVVSAIAHHFDMSPQQAKWFDLTTMLSILLPVAVAWMRPCCRWVRGDDPSSETMEGGRARKSAA